MAHQLVSEEGNERKELKVLKIELEIKETNLNLIHWQTHAGVAKVKLQGLQIEHSIYQDSKYFKGNVKDLKILDLTNYP